MAAKRVQILKQLIPGVSRVAFLWNPNNASHLAYLEEWPAGPILGVEPMFVEVGHPDQLEPAFVTMIQKRPDALSITADPFHMAQVGWIIDFVAKNRLPSLYVAKENVVAGGLLSYGQHRRSVSARGWARPQNSARQKTTDLPVEQPTKFELVINLKTANALGLTLSASLLTTADDVIE